MIRRRQFDLLLFSVLLACTPSNATELSEQVRPADLATPYSVDVWRAEDGLPQNSVQAIVQTRDGYLWVGTQEGLVRFDGVRFTVYDTGNTEGLRSSYIRALFEDHAGVLWIGTDGGGLSRFEDGIFTTFTTADGLSHNTVSAIAEDHEGDLWIGTYGGGLSRLRAGRFSAVTADQGLASNLVRALHVDAEGDLWIGTEGAGLNRMRGGVLARYGPDDGLLPTTVYAIRKDRRGRLWVGTGGGGLYRFADGRFVSVPISAGTSGSTVNAIFEDLEGSLWIGTGGGGLHRIEGRPAAAGPLDPRATSFGVAEGLSNGIVYSIEQDREGSLWIGTGGGGLNCLRRGSFAALTTREGLSHDQTSVVYEDHAGALWIGTWGGGLNCFQGSARRIYGSSSGLSGDVVSSLYEDRRGDLWIGTYGAGLNRLRNGRITVYDSTKGLANDTVWGMAEDRDGALWIGTSGGLSRLEDGAFTTYTARDGLSNEMVRVVHCDRAGMLWLGTNGGGLNRLENGRFVAFTTKDGLASDLVYSIYEEGNGVLWVGTGGGLSRYENGVFSSFTTKDGLCESRVFQILEDRNGSLWMSSNKGIFRVAKKELEAHARMKGPRGRIGCTLYGRAAGMKSSECSGGSQPAGFETRDGRLWFATIQGAVSIDPDRLRTNVLPPPLVIEKVIVDSSPPPRAPAGTVVEVPPGSGELEFHYAALSFLDPGKIRFRYRLEPFQTDWLDAGTRRAAYYTNIPPGTYRFHVTACNSDGLWNEGGASYALRLKPHVYQTRTFLALAAAGMVFAALGVYQLRVKSLKARERDLERLVNERTKDLAEATHRLEEAGRRRSDFVSGVTHELKTPLTLIRLYGETLLYDRGGLDDERSRYCEIITRECDRLTHLVDRVLDSSRIERGQKEYDLRPGDLTATVTAAVEAYAKYLAGEGFLVETELSGALPPARFDPDGIAEALLNLLDNATKYSGSSRTVAVRLYARSGEIVLEVEDHGIGIPRDEAARVFEQFYRSRDTAGKGGYGLGLFLVQHIMKAHGGGVEVESEVGRGSRFRLVLPAGAAMGDPGAATPSTGGLHG